METQSGKEAVRSVERSEFCLSLQVDYKKRNDSVLLAVTSVLLAFNRVQLQCLFTAPHSLVELPKLEEMCNAVK
ncbi:hypothetical protein BHE74_00038435 [Ensete ventricosum]|nr:hypothetical protein BHE74_00038435 [Ensete ventricosum]RZS03879.1 hypothetical protein BHM03_00034111 [Ensete ventricosum]